MLDTQSNGEKPLDELSKDCIKQLTLEGVLQAVEDVVNEILPDDDPPPVGGSSIPRL